MPKRCTLALVLALLLTGVRSYAAEVAVVVDEPGGEAETRLKQEVRSLFAQPPVLRTLAYDDTAAREQLATSPPAAIVALGPKSAAWAMSLRTRLPVLAGGWVVGAAAPESGPGRAALVGWSYADGQAFLDQIGVGSAVAVGPGAPPPGLEGRWIAADRPLDEVVREVGDAKGLVLGPERWPEREALAQRLGAAGKVIYDLRGGEQMVPQAVAGPAYALEESQVARWSSVQLQRLLEGRVFEGVQDARRSAEGHALRPLTIRRLGVDLPWQVVATSRWWVEEGVGEPLGLEQAVRAALTESLQVAASAELVIGAQQDVAGARAELLPSLGTELTGRWIDQDTARASMGNNPELALDGELSLTQVIYSAQAWMQLRSTQHVARAERHAHESTLLDVVLATARAWLGVQRAQAALRVQTQILDGSRANLSLARARKRSGETGRSDLLRWESQIATDSSNVLSAVLGITTARLSLDRVLGRRGGEGLPLAPVPVEAIMRDLGADRLRDAVAGARSARELEALMVRTAERIDPELRQLDALLAANQVVINGTRQSLFVPTVVLQASVSHRFAEGGEGQPTDSTLPGFPAPPDDTSALVALNLQWPLFDGGARYARIHGARADVRRLGRLRDDRVVALHQTVRTSFRTTAIAWSQVTLQRQAADAAKEGLELVTQSYLNGATGITGVLDAQRQLRAAELGLVDAIFGAFDAVLDAQRAVGLFYFVLSDVEKEEWDRALTKSAQ